MVLHLIQVSDHFPDLLLILEEDLHVYPQHEAHTEASEETGYFHEVFYPDPKDSFRHLLSRTSYHVYPNR